MGFSQKNDFKSANAPKIPFDRGALKKTALSKF